MESDSSNQLPNPKRLKTLASEVRYPTGNNILHQFVLDNSDPNNSVSQNCINAVLVAMNGSGVDVNARNNDGYSPIHLAVLKNNIIMVQKLLSCLVNIDVNARCDDFDKSALHLAVELGHLSIVHELLNKRADVNIEDRYHVTALYFAILSGGLDIVKLLVSKGANVDEIERQRGALHWAAELGFTEIVEFLVSNGADINAKDKAYYRTPLHYAIKWCNLEAIKCLVDKGADLNSIDADHQTPLHHAMDSNIEVIQFLVDKGANVNAIDVRGRTPLHHLLCKLMYTLDPYYNRETHNESDNEPDKSNVALMKIRLLLEANADVNIKDIFGHPPLLYAVDDTNSDIVKLFLERDVDLNVKYSNEDDTILHIACYGNDKLDIIEMLLTKGCDVNAKNKSGKTPLHVAVCSKHADYSQLLLERGASVHAVDVEGQTPLHIAVYYGHVEVVRALLDKGADKNAVNKDGKTPLDLAKRRPIAYALRLYNSHKKCKKL